MDNRTSRKFLLPISLFVKSNSILLKNCQAAKE